MDNLDCCQSLYLGFVCPLPAGEGSTQTDATSPLRPRLPPAPTHPPSIPHLAAIEVNIRGEGGGAFEHRQVAPLATRMYLSPDPWRP